METELPIRLDRGHQRPLARQVADQLRDAAAGGVLRVGDRLPSTRTLASSLSVSRTVTAAAYEQLLAEGWIESRRGSGTYLAAIPPVSGASSHPLGPAVSEIATPSAAVDLRPGSPWVRGLRAEVWRRAWRRASDTPPDMRPVRAGLPEYRTAVADHLLRHRGLALPGAAVLATAGTTSAVTELALAVLGAGTIVAVEEPGYARAVGAIRAAGLDVRPAPVDEDGLVVEALPGDATAVYCTPAHQYPLGSRLSAQRRIALVEWARDVGALVIEDDYDGELRYDVAPLPLLAAVGPDVVIHLGTTSKIISPTLGAGWMVAPPAVADAVVSFRNTSGSGPALAGQRVVAAMAEAGDLARHLRRVRHELAARRCVVTSMLASAGCAVIGDRAGAHVVVPLAEVEAERTLVAEAAAQGVVLHGVERSFAGRPRLAGITLGYATPSRRAQLERGVDVVRRLMR